jgi:hypothetical protein
MALEVKTFCTFGRRYRTKQFSAVAALNIMMSDAETYPTEMLRCTEIENIDWHLLDNGDAINGYVEDVTGLVAPYLILKGIMDIVRDHNFGFLYTWRGTKIPARFTSGAKSVKSERVEPMIQQLVADDMATLRELEEYYSLEDAYKMFEIGVVKHVNSAYAYEEATKSVKTRS